MCGAWNHADMGQERWFKFISNMWMETKHDLHAFDRDMFVVSRRAAFMHRAAALRSLESKVLSKHAETDLLCSELNPPWLIPDEKSVQLLF